MINFLLQQNKQGQQQIILQEAAAVVGNRWHSSREGQKGGGIDWWCQGWLGRQLLVSTFGTSSWWLGVASRRSGVRE